MKNLRIIYTITAIIALSLIVLVGIKFATSSHSRVNTINSSNPIVLNWRWTDPFVEDASSSAQSHSIFPREYSDSFNIEQLLAASNFKNAYYGNWQDTADSGIEGVFDLERLTNYKFRGKSIKVSQYGLAVVRSHISRTCYLSIASSPSCTVWVNSKGVYSDVKQHGLYVYNSCVSIEIKEGDNYILVRIPRAGVSWGWKAAIYATSEDATVAALSGQGMMESLLLENCLLSGSEEVKLRPRGVPLDAVGHCVLNRMDGHTVFESFNRPIHAIRWNTGELADGFYEASIFTRIGAFRQVLFKGDLNSTIDKLQHKNAQQDIINEEAAALIARLKYLVDNGMVQLHARTIVSYLARLQLLLGIEPNVALACKSTQISVLPYKSSIDGLNCYAKIYLSSKSSPTPLFVMLPTAVSSTEPYLFSPSFNSHSEAERLSVMASSLGASILWCGYRKRLDGTLVDLITIRDAINAALKTGRIDRNRIYLIGACTGADLAARLITEWPNSFAGIGVLNPDYNLSKLQSPSERTLFPNIEYSEWISETPAYELIPKKISAPIFVVYDGSEVGHGDIDSAKQSVAVLTARGVDARFLHLSQVEAQHASSWLYLYTSLLKFRSANPSLLEIAPHPMTMERFISRPLLMIQPKKITAGLQNQYRDVISKIQRDWSLHMSGEIPLISDNEYDPIRHSQYNLILLGQGAVESILGPSCDVLCKSPDLESHGGGYVALNNICRMSIARLEQRNVLIISSLTGASIEAPPFGLTRFGWYSEFTWGYGSGNSLVFNARGPLECMCPAGCPKTIIDGDYL